MTIATDFTPTPSTSPSRAELPPLVQGRARGLGALALRLLRERIVQFVILGGAIFAVAPRASPADIRLEHRTLGALRSASAARSGGTLSAEQTRDIDERAVEDELLYREGLRLGLDKEDGIVRQRVIQKTLFLAEELRGASRPATEAELRAFFAANQERWIKAERTHFLHVFAHDQASLPPAPPPGAGAAGAPLDQGEPSAVGPEYAGDRRQIIETFGAGFADALEGQRGEGWSDPIASAFGYHRVKILERSATRPARFEEVRASVTELESVARRQDATAAFLRAAFQRYHVELDGRPLRELTPARRLAVRAVASGED